MEVVVSAETREGELVGSGNGSVSGDRLNGTARWSMYAGNCAYVGCREPDSSRHPGNISALFIRLASSKRPTGPKYGSTPEAMGCGADQGQPHLWGLTMAIQFTTTDPRYQWLNTTLGVVVSEFDERAGRALWRAFVP
jgi:hypothetical protein